VSAHRSSALYPPVHQVARIGPQHQAGSDSLLTAATFFKMRKVFFEDKIEDEFYKRVFPSVISDLLLVMGTDTSVWSSRNFLYGFGNTRQMSQSAAGRAQIGSRP
jgi:hypothetical protein